MAEHVNSIVTTMASKCLTAAQVKALSAALEDMKTKYARALWQVLLEKSPRKASLTPEVIAAAVQKMSPKVARATLQSVGKQALNRSLSATITDAILGEKVATRLRAEDKAYAARTRDRINKAKLKLDGLLEDILLDIRFMRWTKGVHELTLNAFRTECEAVTANTVAAMKKEEKAIAKKTTKNATAK